MKLVVTDQAVQDLRDIEEYISKDNPKIALEFVQQLTLRFQQLKNSPGIGRKRDDLAVSMRSSRVGDYLIFYRQEPNRVTIIHVLHGSRDLPLLFQD